MTAAHPQLRLHLLGEVRFLVDGEEVPSLRTRKAEALLIYLAVTGRSHARERLATLLWDESEGRQAMANLRAVLSSLRKHLQPFVEADRQSLAVRQELTWLDSRVFEDALQPLLRSQRSAGAAAPEPLSAAAVTQLQAALDLYQGEFLAGFYLRDSISFDEWATLERERLRHLADRGLGLLVGQLLAAGRYAPAIPYARRRVQLDPLNESAQRDLMLLLARAGQLNAALEQFALCRRQLDEELGVPPAAATAALAARLALARQSQPPPLPQPAQRLVGRGEEMAALRAMLRDPFSRLVTITGLGGAGKTRLALAVARRLAAEEAGRFLHGIYFVPLAAVTDAAQLAPALADTLRLPAAADPHAALLDFVREKELLLVLDNFEQLCNPTGSGLLRDLLDSAPRLSLLVTSQQRLNLRHEQLLHLAGFSVADDASAAADAVALFVDSARRLRPDFAPTAAEQTSIAAICSSLAGMPLGIELCAAWIEHVSLADMAGQLAESLDFAAADWVDVATRHRSLRQVFERSWQLLAPAEQALLPKLALFRTPFTAAAAAAVAGAAPTQLLALARRSLLEQPATGRYDLHAVVRHYAAERLSAAADETGTRQAHAVYFLTFAQQHAGQLVDPGSGAAADMERALADIRAAWQWATADGAKATADGARATADGARATTDGAGATTDGAGATEDGAWTLLDLALGALFDYYLYHSRRVDEGRDLFQAALDAARGSADAPPVLIARLRIRLAEFCLSLGEYEACAAAISPPAPDDLPAGERGLALTIRSRLHYFQGEFSAALPLAEQALTTFRDSDDERGLAFALNLVALMRSEEGRDLGQADRLYEESLRLFQGLGDPNGVARALINLGGNAYVRQQFDRARDYFERSATLYRATNYVPGLATALRNLGLLATELGDYDKALDAAEESLARTRGVGDRAGVIMSLKRVADIRRAQARPRDARDTYLEALQLAVHARADGLVLTLLPAFARLLREHGDPVLATRLLAFLAPRVADNGELSQMVTQDLDALRAQLDEAIYTAAHDQGQVLTMHDVLRTLHVRNGD